MSEQYTLCDSSNIIFMYFNEVILYLINQNNALIFKLFLCLKL